MDGKELDEMNYEEEFNLSEKIEHREIAKMLRVKDVKEFIKRGDKIFFSEDYGNDDVSNEMYDYAVKKWKEFKKLSGDLK